MAKETELVPYSNKPIDVILRALRTFKNLGNKFLAIFKDSNVASFSQGNFIPENVLEILKKEYSQEISTVNMEEAISNDYNIQMSIDKEIKEPSNEKSNPVNLRKIKQHITKDNNKDE